MKQRLVNMDDARVIDERRMALDLDGQPDTEWAAVFDQERLAVLNRDSVPYVQIVLRNESIEVDVFDDAALDDATKIVQEIVDRTNARADAEPDAES